jgi:hypothetical protein
MLGGHVGADHPLRIAGLSGQSSVTWWLESTRPPAVFSRTPTQRGNQDEHRASHDSGTHVSEQTDRSPLVRVHPASAFRVGARPFIIEEMTMTAYAVANLRNVRMGPAIIAYLQAIDATLAPFHGRFIIHGGDKTVR